MRIMAVDFGDARTGIAISDAMGFLTGYSTVIHSRKGDEVATEIAKLVKAHRVEEIVVGLPRNMDGTEGARAETCREFAHQVAELTQLPIQLWDERRTTIEAHSILRTNGKKTKNHKQTVDAVAASLILEGYLVKKRAEAVR